MTDNAYESPTKTPTTARADSLIGNRADDAKAPDPKRPSWMGDGPDAASFQLPRRSADTSGSSGLQTPEDAEFALEAYWNARVKSASLSERLALFRSLYSQNDVELQLWRGTLDTHAVFDRKLQDAGIALFREQQLQQFMMEIGADPAGAEPELVKFRTTINSKDPIVETMAQTLYKTLGSGFATAMRGTIRTSLAASQGQNVGQATSDLIANQAMNPFAKHDKDFDKIVRMAFYEEALSLVRDTRNASLGVGLLRAVGAAMTSRYDDPNIIDEVNVFSSSMRDVVLGLNVMTPGDDRAIRNAEADVEKVEITMLNHRVTLHDVQLRYMSQFVAIKNAFDRVGEKWVSWRTQSLRNRIEDFDRAREMVSRGVNLGWSMCGGPATAFPLVLVGTLVDIALEAEEQVVKQDLSDLEGKLRDILEQKLNSSLGRLYSSVEHDAEKIAQNDLPVIAKMLSIPQMEGIMADALAGELSKVKT